MLHQSSVREIQSVRVCQWEHEKRWKWKSERECVKALQKMYVQWCMCILYVWLWKSWGVVACLHMKSNKHIRCCVCELKERNMKNWENGKTGMQKLSCIPFMTFSLLWLSFLYVNDSMSHPRLNQTLARADLNVNLPFMQIQKALKALFTLISWLIIVCCLPGNLE